MSPSLVVRRIPRLLTMDPARGAGPLGALTSAAVAFEGDRVAWVGPDAEAPDGERTMDGSGCVGLPGLVDCHTHTVWAGSRADEFRRRLAGASYADILEAGGGILSTVEATRAASDEELASTAAARLAAALDRGITTVEVKSGYGLTPAHERRCLVAAREAGRRAGVRVHTTFLGAHTVPRELRDYRAAYVRQVVEEQLPAVADVADDVDVYVDRGAFTVEEGRTILEAGRALGLGVRVHAEQIAHTGAASMAAGLGARSADHLERLDETGIAAMARAGTVAVLLPGAMLHLRDMAPPVAALRAAGVPMAVASDLNPGSSPVGDLWACATLACILMGLTVEEALLGITRHGARALGRFGLGWLGPGSAGDLALVAPPPGEPIHEDALVQRLDGHRARVVVRAGRVVRAA
jgi:imidazolonepropionase